MAFRTNLVIIRMKYRLTQKEMAESIGVRIQAYQAYEHGRSHPNFKVLQRIFDVYKITDIYNFMFYESIK
jgi:transcriptional regulator with XRE-family HTH domain